ncbi:DUF6896 domain-containing protein [Kitasatospora purpeofusca]|uniref:DUF6896 domain-containing protein n=1 Tax=Kitasatospora purpeofusca TaxID=67352 RepID=UPI003F5FBE60
MLDRRLHRRTPTGRTGHGRRLLLAAGRRQDSRSSHIGAHSYTVHRAGCRFVSDNGTEVDVDFAADGSAVFDLWRLRRYGLRLPEAVHVTDADQRSAVRSVQPLLTEVRPGWFSVAS